MTSTSPFRRLVPVRDDEIKALIWATLYGFCIFTAYYILRPVRDEISSADRGNLQIIWTAVFFVMLAAVAAYSWLTTRVARGRFVPLVNRFFLLNLLGFYAALVLLPDSLRPWIDRFFYVWASVFALFAVTVYWGFFADLFKSEQAKRLYPFIAFGASAGAIVGSSISAFLAGYLPEFGLLLAACVPLEIASWCVVVLNRDNVGRGSAPDARRDKPLTGNALSGMRAVARSGYLQGIMLFILLMTFASTVLYFLQADLIADAFADDRTARTAFYAKIDLVVNIVTTLLQLFVTARIIKWIGLAASLVFLPAVTALGFIGMGLFPTLTVLVVLQVLYRAGRYGLAKPAREVLFTIIGREEKYQTKAFLDAAVYRGGDLVSGWVYSGLAAVGLSLGAIALVAAPVAGVWAVVAFRLGRSHDELQANERSSERP
ncbi:MAG: AAA family ATP:ADP antiporter [Rhodothermales bacterium]|jgi:AAA family ATP:ADP antiporter